MNKRFFLGVLTLLCMIFMTSGYVEHELSANPAPTTKLPTVTYVPMEMPREISIADPETILSQKDIELIALVTMAEAEGECEEGKRLVIDTILNRMDSKHFPNTIRQVIYQPNQFSSIWNGRVDRCEVREDICQLVREELKARRNNDVIFFNAGGYSEYGKPLFQIDNHYFSSYN